MPAIKSLADAHGIAVIEDCAQANGAAFNGRAVGTFGTFGAFSFCQDKIITTGGEGGLLVTADQNLWSRAWSYKDHGKSYDQVMRTDHAPGFRWLHESFGTNWRMTEMQAAIGRLQLRKLPDWIAKRRANAAMLAAGLVDLDILRIPAPPDAAYHAYYKFYGFLNPLRLRSGWNRERIIGEVVERGVPCYSGSCSEVYLERAFDHSDSRPRERLPVARELGDTSLMMLVHPTLKRENIDRTVEVVRDVLLRATN
jgi:dTDP-4-amino-4,6-dideoxygalactose transaminase